VDDRLAADRARRVSKNGVGSRYGPLVVRRLDEDMDDLRARLEALERRLDS
jgi:hypothetical protein